MSNQPIRVRKLVRAAAEMFNTTEKGILSPSRRQVHVRPRRMVYLALREEGKSMEQIGRWLNRDHTTVVHGCQVARSIIAQDQRMKAAFEKLKGVL